jgi:hypothetical protein
MDAHAILLALVIGMLTYGLYTLVCWRRASGMAEGAWYAAQSRRMLGSARWLGFRAVALFVGGGGILLWRAFNPMEQAPAEPAVLPATVTQPPPTDVAPTLWLQATVMATPDAPAEDERSAAADAIGEGEPFLVPIPTLVLSSGAVVSNTGGGGLWLRDAPFGNNVVLLPEGAAVFIRGGLLEVDGLLWQQVEDTEGRQGWVAADYLLYR